MKNAHSWFTSLPNCFEDYSLYLTESLQNYYMLVALNLYLIMFFSRGNKVEQNKTDNSPLPSSPKPLH